MPARRLGQVFLHDRRTLEEIVEGAGVSSEDTVVEVGPGPGTLTEILLERAGEVIAVELDSELYARLRLRFPGRKNLRLVRGDALRFPFHCLGRFKVVANIPYQITTPLIFLLLEHRDRLESMTLTIQKEVARRLAASPSSKSYGVLSITVQYYARVELLLDVPAELFRPRPKVDSATVRITPLKEPRVKVMDEELFLKVVRTAFQARRKTLANALKPLTGSARKVLERAEIDPGRRAETLAIEEFAALSDALYKEAEP